MLKLGELQLQSRLLIGTGKYRSFEEMRACHQATGTQMVTVALRRIDLHTAGQPQLLDFVDNEQIHLLPNTAGCYRADDAVMVAQLGREALQTNLVKLEVIGDPKTLYPDDEATVAAARQLVADGFSVMPYCSPDPITCRRLEEAGCIAVMPLASPIGSGLGVQNPYNLMIIVEHANVPVIVDAGLGTASDASIAMELGVDGVLLNTAIAEAKDSVKMATAMKHAVIAGRLAFESGRMPKRLYGSASSPVAGVVGA